MSGPITFRFLGVEHSVRKASDWNCGNWPKLWLYNLHYFDDLTSTGALERNEWHRSMIERWITENPPGKGNGWESYPVSLRVVNWIKWALAGNALEKDTRTNLAVQVRWLRRHLEIQLLGNHLWANAKALVFAGVFFQGKEAERWLTKGLVLLRRELNEQILADGGHFERSPMYHAILLEDLIDLVQLAALFPKTIPDQDMQSWRETVPRMLYWLRVMTHPDGGIAFFNDTALGVAPTCADLIAYADSLGIQIDQAPLAEIEPLEESGYVRMEAGPAVLIADVGKIGPDYLPGHAHADTLSFELSLHGTRVLVNGGTSTYELGEERLRQRGTAAHNTIEVNGENSSEVWASFRVAQRARPLNVAWRKQGAELWLRAAHDGYTRLPRVGLVDRAWRLSSHGLRIEDGVEGKPRRATVRFRTHPLFAFDQAGDCCGRLRDGVISLKWAAPDAGCARIVSDNWHPRFGESDRCQTLELEFGGPRLYTEFSWGSGIRHTEETTNKGAFAYNKTRSTNWSN